MNEILVAAVGEKVLFLGSANYASQFVDQSSEIITAP